MDKQEMIEEIQRTAKLNNGKALGQKRFVKETGIKIRDWCPLLWLRWSDAIKEAGLVPNKFNTAIDNDAAIEKLIGFIRETRPSGLQRVPCQSKSGPYVSKR